MKLPSRMLDLSVPLDNETVLDPPIMRPKIDYKTNKENAWMLLESFPGLRAEDLPDGEGWAFELRCGSNPTRSRQQGRGARLHRGEDGCRGDDRRTRLSSSIIAKFLNEDCPPTQD